MLINGTPDNDSLLGGSAEDTILGGAGNDTLDGGGGNGSLDGGAGDDSLIGALDKGSQVLLGGDGNDVFSLFGISGNYDSKRTLVAEGGAGDDVFDTHFYNAPDKITLSGGAGSDTYRLSTIKGQGFIIADFTAGVGGDRLDLRALIEQDVRSDGAGGNPLGTVVRLVQQGGDTLVQAHYTVDRPSTSGAPYQTVAILKGVSANALTAANFVDELSPGGAAVRGIDWRADDAGGWKSGTYYDDTLVGGGGDDSQYGGGGADLLDGGAGNDNLSGGGGNDTLLGGAGNDLLRADSGSDSLRGGDGDDDLRATLDGGVSFMYGDAGDDLLGIMYSYGRGAVSIDGGSGNDTVVAYAGTASSNVATGGAGSDTYELIHGDAGLTITDFTAGIGGDIIDVDYFVESALNGSGPQVGGNPFSSTNNVLRLKQSGADTLLLFDADGSGTWAVPKTILVLKNFDASTLTSDNFVRGYKLDGAYMPGQLMQPQGNGSFLDGSSYDDTMIGTVGNDSFNGRKGNDLLDGGIGNDVLEGGGGVDTLLGGAGDDRLAIYGSGLLDGGLGNDTLTVSSNADITVLVADGGDGDDQIQLYGSGPAQGIANVNGGNGNDTITFSSSYSGVPLNWIVTGGAGSDTYVLNWNSYAGIGNEFKDRPTIDDFQAGAGGDRLDLANIVLSSDLYKETGGNPFSAGSVLRIVQDGTDTLLQVDLDGPDAKDSYHTFAILKNVQASALTADNFLRGYQPDGRVMTGVNLIDNGSYNGLNGTEFNDILVGGIRTTALSGMGGDDELRANNLPGRGTALYGGGGTDTLTGGEGNDTLDGGKGNDIQDGGAGDDSLISDAGRDTLLGGAGNDTLQFYSSYLNDQVIADGGVGNDWFQLATSGQRSLTLTGGEGVDRYVFWASTYNFDEFYRVTDFLAGSGGDVLDFSHLSAYGHATADPFDPELHVLRWLQHGDDTYLQYYLSWAADYKTLIVFENVRAEDIVAANFAGVDVKASGYSELFGGLGVDTLTGSARDESLDGGAGNDYMAGGQGNDRYLVNDARDTVVEAAGGGTDAVRASVNYVLPDHVESLTLIGAASQARSNVAGGILYANDKLDSTLLGAGGNDTLLGSAHDDYLDGATGDDSLSGQGGDDLLRAGGGSDTVDGGSGVDVLQLQGDREAYVVTKVSSTDTRFDNAATGESVLVRAVEWIQFTDGVRNLAQLLLTIATEGNDVLTGSSDSEMLTGRGGNDTLRGLDGNDTLDGGSGNDSLSGGAGDDVYLVDASGDQVAETANGGIDTVRTSLSTYILGANVENLAYSGSADFAGVGNALHNVITGGSGADSLQGGAGNDTFVGADGKDTIDGGADSDVLQLLTKYSDYTFSRPNAIDTLLTDKAGNVTTVRNVETFIFAGEEHLLNDLHYNLSSVGNDKLYGGDGADTLNGGQGADTMSGGQGDDVYVVDDAADVVIELAGDGADLVQVGLRTAGTYSLSANVENAIVISAVSLAVNLTGNALDNALAGNGAANTLLGGAGNDTLDGGAGADKLSGGIGNDTYIVDVAGDTVTEALNEGTDTVKTTLATYTLGNNVENLDYSGKAAFTGTGNALGNAISGGNGGSKLDGGAGNDTLTGGSGNDSLQGGIGDDSLIAAGGKDTIDGGLGNDVLRVGGELVSYTITRPNATDTVLTGPGGQVVTVRNVENFQFADGGKTLAQVQDNIASVGNDVLHGGDGNDSIDGLGGVDTVAGGAGGDTYVIYNAASLVLEHAGEGNDLVQVALAAAGTYTLAANVENATVTAAAKVAVNLAGNALDNQLTGNAAANTLNGGGGDDTLDGGAGADKLIGGTGNDTYVVDVAGDTVTEALNEGADTVRTALATYTLGNNVENLAYTGKAAFSGTGNLLDNDITGGDQGNKLDGGAGNDTLHGGAGNDSLLGGSGDDALHATPGNDTIDGGVGNDRVTGLGARSDYVIARPNASDVVLVGHDGSMLTVRNVETLAFADGSLAPAALANVATTGNDLLSGTGNDDAINGLAGADTMAGGIGNDSYTVDALGDVVIEAADEGNDTVNVALAAAGTYALADNVEIAKVISTVAVNLTGNALDNLLVGNAAANTLLGGDGNDTLNGGAGSDSLAGGAGDDVYVVDAAGDKVVEAAGAGTDRVETALASYTLAANVENLRYTGSAAFSGSGNALANLLQGGAGADVLSGAGGSDTLIGGAGNDKLTGGAIDADYFVLNSLVGSDTITDFASGVDVLQLDMAALGIGNRDALLDGAIVSNASGGFGTDAELVLFTQKMASATTAKAALIIGSASSAYAVGDTALFALSTATATLLYRFQSSNNDAQVSAAELTVVATLTGTPTTVLADYATAALHLA
jgi:Ca2+-binding RTX toxin-like protein